MKRPEKFKCNSIRVHLVFYKPENNELYLYQIDSYVPYYLDWHRSLAMQDIRNSGWKYIGEL